MAIRERYQHDLAELQQRLLELGDLVDKTIVRALWVLNHKDIDAARRLIDDDTTIDDIRYAIEDQALGLIARQQPLARDLRIITALSDLASELERIGDYAEGIAEIVIRNPTSTTLAPPYQLDKMANAARDMLRQSMRAVAERDAEAGERLQRADDHVDTLYQQIFQEMLIAMREDPDQSEAATYFIWAAHNLERIADRTVNIGERAAFIATGTLTPRRS